MEEPGSSNWRNFRKLRPTGKQLQKNAEKIEKATVKHAHKFIISRFENIRSVRRHAIGWALAICLLITLGILQLVGLQHSYSSVAQADGGVYAEGVVGQLDVINPLFASTPAERAASHLIFSGLLSYDTKGALRGELAESWRVERDGIRYVVELKPGITWHDGRTVTADDILFTVGLMQDPAVRSQQYQSWSGVSATKLSDRTVAFDLPRAYAAFPHAMTFGILPKHIFDEVAPEALRESPLNRQPVGSGPFVFSRMQIIDPDLDRMVVYLTRNDTYVHGAPRLERFQLHTFMDSEKLATAFAAREINAAGGLSAGDTEKVVNNREGARAYETGIDGGVYAFMNNDSAVFKDKSIRQALTQATDRNSLRRDTLFGHALPLGGPLINDQINNAPSQLTTHPFNAKKAGQLLDKAGWRLSDGQRKKDGKTLTVRLVSIRADDYPAIAKALTEQWKAVGIDVQSQLVDPETVQQNVIVPRAFDVLVYELAIGADPDVFAFWHRSQAGPRGLNLSNYKSDVASEALSSAQLRFEPRLRTEKYEAFVATWVKDIPAIALYQPTIGYVTSQDVSALKTDASFPARIERYADVHNWTVQQERFYSS